MAKQYKKNYLSQVVFKLDFPSNELGQLSNFYKNNLKAKFPFTQEKKVVKGAFQINTQSGSVEKSENQFGTLYIFETKSKNKSLEIGENHILLNYKKYNNSEDFFKDIAESIKPFIEFFKINTIKRIGLRYINNIKLKPASNFTWDKYIDKKLTEHIDFAKKDGGKISRGMGQLVFKESLGDITFNYGIWNSEFPNEAIQNEFVLDFDHFSRLPFKPSEEDIIERAKNYQARIESLFEKSITSEFRKHLNK